MSLAIPINIATRSNRVDFLCALLAALPEPSNCYVYAGQFTGHRIEQSELVDVAKKVANCSIAYVLDSSRGGMRLPIAAFVANEPLGVAKLQYLLDGGPAAVNATIPRQTIELLGVYVRLMFTDFDWLETVTVPSNVELLNGLFQMSVESDGVSKITLADTKHRPQSTRNWNR